MAWSGLEWVGAQFDEARLDDMLIFKKESLRRKKNLYQRAPRFLTNVNNLLTMKCFQIRLYLIKALTQTIEKKEELVSFVAYLITNLINV